MNLVDALAREHSKAQCNAIVDYIGTDARRFGELIKIFLAGPYRMTQRAAWPLNYCVERHPELIRPHLRTIVQNLKKPGLHDAVKRNTVRMLQFINVPKSLQGLVTKVCFGLFRDVTEPVAVRIFSMSVLADIARDHPDLKNELILLIEDQLPYGSAGFLSRARRVLTQLKS